MHQRDRFRAWGLPLALAVLAVTAVGCVKARVLVHVNPDGSGNIVVTQLYSPQMIRSMLQSLGARDFGGDSGFTLKQTNALQHLYYNEAVLRRLGVVYGSAVTFVKGKEVSQAGVHGCIAVYAFPDINDVQIDPAKLLMMQSYAAQSAFSQGGDGEAPSLEDLSGPMAEKLTGGKAAAVEFKFQRTNDVSTLHILMPPPGADAIALSTNSPATTNAAPASGGGRTAASAVEADVDSGEVQLDGEGPEVASAMGMDREMMSGLGIAILVETGGTLIKANGGHPDPRRPARLTLLDADLTRMMAAPEMAKQMNMMEMLSGDEGLPGLLTAIKEAPGFVRESRPEVDVEFR